MRRVATALWTLLALGWALLVWWLLTIDLPSAPMVSDWVPALLRPWLDKVAHAGLFLVQALLCERAARERLGGRRAVLLAVALCAVFGVVTELRQRSLPHRDGDVADLAADLAGAFPGAAALPLSGRWRRSRARARAATGPA